MISDPSSTPRYGVWKHKKTEHIYHLMGFAIQESTLIPCVLYVPADSPGGAWIQPCYEFFDGRFEKVS